MLPPLHIPHSFRSADEAQLQVQSLLEARQDGLSQFLPQRLETLVHDLYVWLTLPFSIPDSSLTLLLEN